MALHQVDDIIDQQIALRLHDVSRGWTHKQHNEIIA
jgi:hypothetical protein